MMIEELMRGETVREFVVEESFVDRFWFGRLGRRRVVGKGEEDDGLGEFVRKVEGYKVVRGRLEGKGHAAGAGGKVTRPLSILTPQPSP